MLSKKWKTLCYHAVLFSVTKQRHCREGTSLSLANSHPFPKEGASHIIASHKSEVFPLKSWAKWYNRRGHFLLIQQEFSARKASSENWQISNIVCSAEHVIMRFFIKWNVDHVHRCFETPTVRQQRTNNNTPVSDTIDLIFSLFLITRWTHWTEDNLCLDLARCQFWTHGANVALCRPFNYHI